MKLAGGKSIMVYRAHTAFFVVLLVSLVGCAGSPPSPTDTVSPGTPESSADPVAFAEDGDPLVEGLGFVSDELLIRSKPGATADALLEAYAQSCTTVSSEIAAINVARLNVNPARLQDAADVLADNPLIESVQKNYQYQPTALPNDPRFASQSYLEQIGLPDAWDTTTGASNIIIAVLDTGVATDHPDLAGKVTAGWNIFDDSSDTADVAGHGTAVAGVAAALSNNRTGVVGVSWQSTIMPVRVTNPSGQATSFDIAAGLVWAADHGAQIANASFAPLASDRTVQSAAGYFKSSGGLVFISAGNDGKTTSSEGSPDAIYVGATTEGGDRAFFSTQGPFVDVTAPGVGIAILDHEGGYQTADGTSFASPIAAGIAALIWSIQPQLRPVTVEQVLLFTASDLGSVGKDDQFGMGLVDAAAAVAASLDAADVTDAAAPQVAIIDPADNSDASGAISVSVDASDDAELADVVLLIDGQFHATDDHAPFEFGIETRDLSSGVHTLTSQAADVVGNLTTSAPIRIVVEASAADGGDSDCDLDGPVVVFNFPSPESEVTGRVAIQITATDNLGVVAVDWFIDGVASSSGSLSGVRDSDTFIWDATNATPGSHTISVTVIDVSGNIATTELELVKP